MPNVTELFIFLDTHAWVPIIISEEHKRVRLKVEEGVRLSLEAIQRAEEEEEHTRLESEEGARIFEEARLKVEEDEE